MVKSANTVTRDATERIGQKTAFRAVTVFDCPTKSRIRPFGLAIFPLFRRFRRGGSVDWKTGSPLTCPFANRRCRAGGTRSRNRRKSGKIASRRGLQTGNRRKYEKMARNPRCEIAFADARRDPCFMHVPGEAKAFPFSLITSHWLVIRALEPSSVRIHALRVVQECDFN